MSPDKKKTKDFLESLLSKVSKQFPPLDWALNYHMSTRGGKMSFGNASYLLKLYMHDFKKNPIVYVKSSVQSGKSEWVILRALTWCNEGLTVLYTLPDEKLKNRFVRNRLDKTLQLVPFYKKQLMEATGSAKNVNLKHFGKGTLAFANSSGVSQFLEIPADALIADEYDRFDLSTYERAYDRLSSSPYKYIIEIANPTISDFGIDFKFQKSNQNIWHIKCPYCNTWQNFDWFKQIVRQIDDTIYEIRDKGFLNGIVDDIRPLCIKCEKPLNRHALGEWIPTYPNRNEYGYQISKLFTINNPMKDLFDKFISSIGNAIKTQVFYNSDLGECYTAKGAKLTLSSLKECEDAYEMLHSSDKPCIGGVDVGSSLHVIIGEILPEGATRVIYIEKIELDEDFSSLDKLFIRYPKLQILNIDMRPETRAVKNLHSRHPQKVFMTEYIDGYFDFQVNYNENRIKTDRTTIMDDVLQTIIGKTDILPLGTESICSGEFAQQMTKPTRVFQEKNGDLGTEKGRYVYVGNPDHFYHAYNYMKIARKMVNTGTVVMTADLNKPYKEAAKKATENDIGPQMEKVLLPPGTHPSVIAAYKRMLGKK